MAIIFQDGFESGDKSNWTAWSTESLEPEVISAPAGMVGSYACQLKSRSSWLKKTGLTPSQEVRLYCLCKPTDPAGSLYSFILYNVSADEGVYMEFEGGIGKLIKLNSMAVLQVAFTKGLFYNEVRTYDIRARFSTGSDGIVQFYVNGVVIIDYRGPNMVSATTCDGIQYGSAAAWWPPTAHIIDEVILRDDVVFNHSLISMAPHIIHAPKGVGATGVHILDAAKGVGALSAHIFDVSKAVGAVSVHLFEPLSFGGLTGARTFPLPKTQTKWQTQTDKRKFPLPGSQ